MAEIEEVAAIGEKRGVAVEGVAPRRVYVRDRNRPSAGGGDPPDRPGVVAEQDDSVAAPRSAEHDVRGIAERL
jgi:hypothetical protein